MKQDSKLVQKMEKTIQFLMKHIIGQSKSLKLASHNLVSKLQKLDNHLAGTLKIFLMEKVLFQLKIGKW